MKAISAGLPERSERPFDGFESADGVGQAFAQAGLIRSMMTRWRTALMVLAITMGAAWIFVHRVPPAYRSEARVQVRPGVLRAAGDDGATPTSLLYTQSRVIASLPVLTDAAIRIGDHAPLTFEGKRPTPTEIQLRLSASSKGGEDLLSLTFDGVEPGEAAVALDAVTSAFEAYHARRRTEVAARWEAERRRLLMLITDQRQAAGALGVGGLAGDARLASDGTAARGTGGELAAARDGVSRQAQALAGARSMESTAAAALQAAERSPSPTLEELRSILRGLTPGEALPDPADSVALAEELRVAQRQLVDARARFLEGHPLVARANANVEALRLASFDARARASAACLESIRQRARDAAARVAVAQADYDQAAAAAARDEARLARQSVILTEVGRLERAMDAVSARSRELESAAPAVEVVEAASLPTEPVTRPHIKAIAMGLCLGIPLAALAALVRDRTDARVRDTWGALAAVQSPVLGVMPTLAAGGAHSAARAVLDAPGSAFAEAVREVRTSLLLGRGGPPRTIVVTSPAPGEGKSTLAANLAASLAAAGRRVILFDADFHRPVQSQHVRCEPSGDFADLIAGRTRLADACQESGAENLRFLGCRQSGVAPSELLNTQAFADLLEDLTLQCDHVVIDAPPLDAVVDARILAASADATVLVVRMAHTRLADARRARVALEMVGARVAGAVVNRVAPRELRYAGAGAYVRATDRAIAELPRSSAVPAT